MQPSHVLLDGRPDPRRADPVDRLHPKEVALEHEPPNARECTNVSSRLCHRPTPTATRSRPDARRELHKRAGNRSKNASVREMRGAALISRFTRSKRGTRSREMFARTLVVALGAALHARRAPEATLVHPHAAAPRLMLSHDLVWPRCALPRAPWQRACCAEAGEQKGDVTPPGGVGGRAARLEDPAERPDRRRNIADSELFADCAH